MEVVNQAMTISNNTTILISLSTLAVIFIGFYKIVYNYIELKMTVQFIQKDIKDIRDILKINNG